MTLYDHAKAARDTGRTIADAMAEAGANLVTSQDWPVVRAIKAARAEFRETRDWPVRVWVRNGPGEGDPFEAIAAVGDVVFDLSETPETKAMTDEQIRLYTVREVRRQIGDAIAESRRKFARR